LKFFKVLMKAFIFIVGLLVSLWVFMPWGKIGEYAVLSAERIATSRGIVNARHTSVSGSWRGPTIRINDFTARNALGGGEFKVLSLSPSFMQSIIQFSPVVSVSFTGAKLLLPGGNETGMDSGKVDLSLKKGILLLKNLKSTGELSFEGFVAIDTNGNKIETADLMIKPPQKIEPALNLMKTMLPLTQESTGQWRLKRDKDG